MAATQNILILSSRTGGGHVSAASALKDSFDHLSSGELLVKITQVLEEAGAGPKRLGEIYNYLLRHHQDWVQYYYWIVNNFRLNESKVLLKGAFNYGKHMLEKASPDMVVSVHPMTHHLYAYALKRLGLNIPIVTVVTDPCGGFWQGWACDDVSQYYVATEAAKQQLEDYHIDGERIDVVGMPVHQRFQPIKNDERPALRMKLGLLPERFTVFVNAGWVGGGNIPKIMDALTHETDLPIQVIYLCGHNTELARQGEYFAKRARFPIHVLGFRRDIVDLMNASDVMISKLGGLTTFEAMACQLPIIGDCTTRPMPQEEETAEFIKHSGAGLLLHKPNDVGSLIRVLSNSTGQCQAMRHIAGQHARQGAKDIAQAIIDQH